LKSVLILLIGACALLADGGSVVLRKQAGPLLITVFGTPRVGVSDFSVLVQKANDPVLDADVELRVDDAVARAVHGTNKLMYAAAVRLAHAGKLPIAVRVGGLEVSGEIQVEPEAPPIVAYWPYFALVPLAIVLFALNQCVKSKRRVRRL
jgi:hypothetical protein